MGKGATIAAHLTGRQKIKLFLRAVIAGFLFYSGVNALYRYSTGRKQTVILMYHRVLTHGDIEEYIQPGMYVTGETFEMQMRYLAAQYRVIALDQLVTALRERSTLVNNSCVITFDDGWRDTYTTAFPILRNYQLPATVFLVSDYVGTNGWFWPDRVAYLIATSVKAMHSQSWSETMYPVLRERGIFMILKSSQDSITQTIGAVIERMKQLDASERDKVLHELEELFQGSRPFGRPMMVTWPQVLEMSRGGIHFGSHTKSHAILTKVSNKEATEEIVASQEMIEKKLGTPCTLFCYPNGDRNDEVKTIVQNHYKAAVTTRHGSVNAQDDLWALKRIAIHNDVTYTKAMFACRISGLLNLLRL